MANIADNYLPINPRIRILLIRCDFDPQKYANCKKYKEFGTTLQHCKTCEISKYCSTKCEEEHLEEHQTVCQKVGHLRKLVENLDELYMKIPDQHKPLPKLEDDDFLDFITIVYTHETKLCTSCKCIWADIRKINRQSSSCCRVYK